MYDRTANILQHYHWFACKMTSEKQVQKSRTVSEVISQGNQWWHCKILAVFSGSSACDLSLSFLNTFFKPKVLMFKIKLSWKSREFHVALICCARWPCMFLLFNWKLKGMIVKENFRRGMPPRLYNHVTLCKTKTFCFASLYKTRDLLWPGWFISFCVQN